MRWMMCALLLASCGTTSTPIEEPSTDELARDTAAETVTITVIGTNDLHGHVRALPVFAGYLQVLREMREADGALVLLDGGDMFQGTLESNLLEGAPIVEAYAALGYDAVTIGNHEFDYGPVGERATPQEPGDERRGALLARAAEARYPFLAANLRMRDGSPIAWDHVQTSVLLERGGLSIGVIGVTTEQTLTTTNVANVDDLSMVPVVEALTAEANALRARGAQLVLVAAHAGGKCTEHGDPHDLGSCEPDQEIFEVANALPEGTIDLIVAGHTHQAVSHFVNTIPIIESYSYGAAFGRIDLVVNRRTGRVLDTTIHPPRSLCETGSAEHDDCVPGRYEGRAVSPVAAMQAIIAPSIANAAERRARPLNVSIVGGPITQRRSGECALGNLFTDLMREARGADVALTNGGGLRADLPAGPLTYGALYEASPFDNLYATVRLSRAELEAIVARNLQRDGSFLSLSGVAVHAGCEEGVMVAHVTRADGRAIADDETLTLVTTDFLATGSSAFAAIRERGGVTLDAGPMVRDSMADALQELGGELLGSALYDSEEPRVRYAGERPVACAPVESTP